MERISLSRVELLLRKEDCSRGEYRVALFECELYRIAEYLARDYKTDINVVLRDTVRFILGLD